MVDFACLYERFDPAVPLAADKPTDVDWQAELGLGDVKRQLVNSITLMGGRPSTACSPAIAGAARPPSGLSSAWSRRPRGRGTS